MEFKSVISKMAKFKDSIEEFLTETSVHGFKYLSVNFNKFVKLFWFVFISLGFAGAGILVYQTLQDAYDNPVLTTTDTTSITEYPFPAITVDSGKSWIRF